MAAWKGGRGQGQAGRKERRGVLRHRRCRQGQSAGRIGNLYLAQRAGLFAPFAVRGVLWDQGRKRHRHHRASISFHLMGALIKGWRKEWNQDFPFLYMQKTRRRRPPRGTWENPTTKAASKFAPLPAQVPGNVDGIYREGASQDSAASEDRDGHEHRSRRRHASG